MRSTIRPITTFSCLLAILSIAGCYNSKMVGAATKVTGGRVFKTGGLWNNVEQQLLFDLQGLGLAPGDLMRNGGLGDQGMHYTLEYAEQSKLQCFEYAFEWKGDGNVGADAFVAKVGGLLEQLDRLGAELTIARIDLKKSNTSEDKEDLLDRIGGELRKIDPAALERMLEQLNESGLLEAAHPSRGPSVRFASFVQECEPQPDKDHNRPRMPKAKNPNAKKPTAKEERAKQAREDLAKLRERICETTAELDRYLQNGRNYLIFRWSDERSGSAEVRVADPLKFSSSESQSSSGFAVIAGLRRSRLLLGRDLSEYYHDIDPKNQLVKWFEDHWSATGFVTESLEVEQIQYFTTGQSERASKIVAAFTPSQLGGANAIDLLGLKLAVELNDERLTSYANRAQLSKPKLTTTTIDFSSPYRRDDDHAWTTLWAVSTTLRYLDDVGRLER